MLSSINRSNKGTQMKKWTRTEDYKIPKNNISGLYVGKTKSGRNLICFSESKEDAFLNLITGVSREDELVNISRESANEW